MMFKCFPIPSFCKF